jgi:hypothetical protein
VTVTGWGESKEGKESTSFLEKRSKKLLLVMEAK